jgi:hypothetical protein
MRFVEKALLDELRSHYLHPHQIAVRAERDAVKAAGVPWFLYQSFMKRYERRSKPKRSCEYPAISISRRIAIKEISRCCGAW